MEAELHSINSFQASPPVATSGEPALDDQLPDAPQQESSELPAGTVGVTDLADQGERLARLSDSDEIFYYENGSNSAVFISIGIHCLVFLLLIYTWKTTFFKGASDEQTAQGGICLLYTSDAADE